MSARHSLERRRARSRRLRNEGFSVREIAKRLGISASTAHNDLSQGVAAKPISNIQRPDGGPVAGAEPGNERALKHGVNSERHISPLRKKHAVSLRRSYPALDERRLSMLADRMARIEAASAWLDDRGGIIRDDEGEVFAVVRELERWISRAEQVLAEIEAESKRSQHLAGLDAYLEVDEEHQK